MVNHYLFMQQTNRRPTAVLFLHYLCLNKISDRIFIFTLFFLLSLILSLKKDTRIELPSQNRRPKIILIVQLPLTCNTVQTVATQTTPPIIPKTDPFAIFAAFFEPEAIPTIKTAVIITAGNAAKIPARIFHGEITVIM